MKRIIILLGFLQISLIHYGQIIADHSVVDKFDDIPQYYIDQVKKMWLTVPGESHSEAYRRGLELLEAIDPSYAVSKLESGTPEAYTESNLRISRGTWGDWTNASGWIYDYGEEDWWTNSTAIARTKAGITYCNTHSLEIAAIGFGWCYDMYINHSNSRDPIYNCYWYGYLKGCPEGGEGYAMGLDANDATETGLYTTKTLDNYLDATQQYIDYCAANGYKTKVFFTTGPVDTYATGEEGYQGFIKHEYIRHYVQADASRILFDYADILCFNDNGTNNTSTYDGHVYQTGTITNTVPDAG